jgi:cell division septation protein DedD
MAAVRSSDQPIELKIERRQVALLGVAVLVLFGVVFSLGVLVGRQIASSSLSAPQQPPPGDLAALDAANRAPKAPKVVAPPPVEEAKEIVKPVEEKPDAAEAAPEKRSDAPGNEPADDDEPAARPEPKKPAAKVEPKAAPPPEPKPEPKKAEPPAPKAEPERKAAAKEKPAKAAHASDAGKFTVQLGASPDQKVALKLEGKARAAGFDVHVLEVDLGSKGTWYRVRVGSFANKDDAAKVQKDAERQLRVPAMVMPAQ